jgi:hypothetical protein
MTGIDRELSFSPGMLEDYILAELADHPYTPSDSDEHWIEPDGPDLLYSISSYANIEFKLDPLGINYTRNLGFMDKDPGKELDVVNRWRTPLVQVHAGFDARFGGDPTITAYAPIRDLEDKGVLDVLEVAAFRAECIIGPTLVHFMDDEYLDQVTELYGWPDDHRTWPAHFAKMGCPILPKDISGCWEFMRDWAAAGLEQPFVPAKFAKDLGHLGRDRIGIVPETRLDHDSLSQVCSPPHAQSAHSPTRLAPQDAVDGARSPRYEVTLPPQEESGPIEYLIVTERIAVFARRSFARHSIRTIESQTEVMRLSADLAYVYKLAHAIRNWPDALLLIVDEPDGTQLVIWISNDLANAPLGKPPGTDIGCVATSLKATERAVTVLEELWLRDRQG